CLSPSAAASPRSSRCPDSYLSRTPPTPLSPLFPYTTLFRSLCRCHSTMTGRSAASSATSAITALISLATTTCSTARTSRSTSPRSEEHTSELQSRFDLVCRLLLEKKKKIEMLKSRQIHDLQH